MQFNKGLKEIMRLDGRIDKSTEKDKQLGAELESQISALEQSYESLAINQVISTQEFDGTDATKKAPQLTANLAKEDSPLLMDNQGAREERLESAEEERIDLKELENLGVDLVQRDLSPLPHNPNKYESYSDEGISRKAATSQNKKILPKIPPAGVRSRGRFQSSGTTTPGPSSPEFLAIQPLRYKGKNSVSKD